MEAAWRALAEEQDWLDGKFSLPAPIRKHEKRGPDSATAYLL
jgi:hypothetical protein